MQGILACHFGQGVNLCNHLALGSDTWEEKPQLSPTDKPSHEDFARVLVGQKLWITGGAHRTGMYVCMYVCMYVHTYASACWQ